MEGAQPWVTAGLQSPAAPQGPSRRVGPGIKRFSDLAAKSDCCRDPRHSPHLSVPALGCVSARPLCFSLHFSSKCARCPPFFFFSPWFAARVTVQMFAAARASLNTASLRRGQRLYLNYSYSLGLTPVFSPVENSTLTLESESSSI